jgi:hypothetical protein
MIVRLYLPRCRGRLLITPKHPAIRAFSLLQLATSTCSHLSEHLDTPDFLFEIAVGREARKEPQCFFHEAEVWARLESERRRCSYQKGKSTSIPLFLTASQTTWLAKRTTESLTLNRDQIIAILEFHTSLRN